jgi:hypothetical protein
MLWLAVPAVATLIASVGSWLRHRPLPLPDTDEAMQAHSAYLAALNSAPRGGERGPRGS